MVLDSEKINQIKTSSDLNSNSVNLSASQLINSLSSSLLSSPSYSSSSSNTANSLVTSTIVTSNTPASNTTGSASSATCALASTAATLITASTLAPISPSIKNNSSVFDSICELTNKNLIFLNQNNINLNSHPVQDDNDDRNKRLSMLLDNKLIAESNSPTDQHELSTPKTKQKHPNIHHRPTIHPNKHHQRFNNLTLKVSENCMSSILVSSEQTSLTTPTSPGSAIYCENSISNWVEHKANENYPNQTIESEAVELEIKIKQIQDLIQKLNSEIFKNPRNCTKPPTEYLEIYNTFTEELHNLQIRKQKLDAQNDQTETVHNQNSKEIIDNEKTNFYDIKKQQNDNISNITTDSRASISPTLNSPLSKSEDFDQQYLISMSSNISDQRSEAFDAKKPPLPKSISGQAPKFKQDHPIKSFVNSSASSNNNSNNPSVSTSPISIHERPQNLLINDMTNINSGNDFISIPSSLPISVLNQSQLSSPSSKQTINPNSRSFENINDAILAPGIIGLLNSNIRSPPSSIANTPTHHTSTLSSSFLRIYIGTSTAVIEKKPIPLQDVLFNKLKSRNLEVDKCIAYIKESYVKIEWDVEVSKILAENIVIAELSEENQHSFEKKSFTIRACESCKKRFLLNAYSCTKCEYIMCQRNECRSKSERIVCVPRRTYSSAITSTPTQTPFKDILDTSRPDSPIRETAINISQQILPVNQLKVSIPSRDRSRSETELPGLFQKEPIPTNPGSSIFPRPKIQINQPVNSNASYGISGSVNGQSGSVTKRFNKHGINSTINSSDTEDKVPEKLPEKPSTLHKPNRRDSFNSWEIPFDKIKIDLSKKVGSGSFGIVHQGHDFYHGVIAIKFLNVQNPTATQANAFRNEVVILKSTRHDNILLFIGCILKPYLAIVTEWCPGSSLYRHIHVEEEYWEMNQLVDIAKQTATGMEYLHARDILHRDLKSNNIFLIPKETNNYRQHQRYYHHQNNGGANAFDLMNEEDVDKWTVKIGDFGLATAKSTWTQTSAKTNQPTGSILWMAPEVITQKVPDPYTQKSDVYSFAVVLYELVTGNLPYSKKEQNTILFQVGSGRLKLNPEDARKDTPKGIKDLIQICSEYDRNKRLDFVEINEKLKNIRPVKLKTKIQRSQSAPIISYSQDQYQSYMSGLGFYDDDFYPGTPRIELFSRQMNLPTTTTPKFEMNFNNNNKIKISNISQL